MVTVFITGLLLCKIPGNLLEEIIFIFRDGIISGLMLAFAWDACVAGDFGDIIDYVTVIGGSTSSACPSGKCTTAYSMMVWILTSIGVMAWKVYQQNLVDRIRRPQYLPIGGRGTTAPASNAAAAKLKSYKGSTLTYASNLETTNYIDPDELRHWFPLTQTIFDLAVRIAPIHGFQVDNSRGQAEHLLMLIFNETRAEHDEEAPQRIHARLFQNYVKWCARMEIEPNFSASEHPFETTDLLVDMLVYLHIWGEAANLRHIPECICFLFHKSMDTQKLHRHDRHVGTESEVYAGFFLDMVVRPLYEVVAAAMAKNDHHRDHVDHKIYDDFNEFFWNPECLQYALFDAREGAISSLALAMQAAPKTYMEKRSWFHPLYSMNRLFEWHTITFTILATLAFSTLLQWTWIFTCKVGSVVFLQISIFGILWTCLEVWTLFPTVEISLPSLCGYLIRILAGYLVLTYQTIYFHWAFVDRKDTSLQSIALFNEGNDLFWWWQYIWLSLMACSLYAVQAVLALFPGVVSSVLQSKNEWLQALLSIVYPNSQLYVGKDTSLPAGYLWYSVLYWLTLLTFKLWFGYYYVVSPVATPTLELYDDFMNFHRPSFFKTSVLMFFWWMPHFLVYIIDLSIWYAVWSSIAGGIVAMYDRLGAVRDPDTFRAQFIRAPILFYERFMPPTTVEEDNNPNPNQNSSGRGSAKAGGGLSMKKKNKSTDSLTNFVLNANENSLSQLPSIIRTKKGGVVAPAVGTAAAAGSGEEKTSTSPKRPSPSSSSTAVKDRRAIQMDHPTLKKRQWTVFARVWNGIIHKLRERDLISNQERDYLLFTSFAQLTKPTYLPLYQTVGCVYTVAFAYREAHDAVDQAGDKQLKMKLSDEFVQAMDPSAVEAAHEAWELFSILMDCLLGTEHEKDFRYVYEIIARWASDKPIYLFGRVAGSALPAIVTRAGKIAALLKGGLDQRRKSPVKIPTVVETPSSATLSPNAQAQAHAAGTTEDRGSSQLSPPASAGTATEVVEGSTLKRSLSSGYLQNLEKQKKYQSSAFARGIEIHDKLRDRIRDEFKGILQTFVQSLKANTSDEANNVKKIVTKMLSAEHGFWNHDAYASTCLNALAEVPDVQRMVTKLEGLLNLQVTDVELKSLEAKRRLNFFLNSLYMDVPRVPETRFSREYTIVTPYYEEDILLTEKDLKAENSDRISVMLYLQTLYRDEWDHFLKRLNIQDENDIWSPVHVQETRMWASCRAQTLYRTVEGMMYNEQAIRLLAQLEQSYHHRSDRGSDSGLVGEGEGGGGEEVFMDGYGPRYTDDEVELLCKVKFNYVVACQVYGEFKKAQDPKALDVEFLMEKFPNIRVAYIDNHRVLANQSDYYSVLIKYEPATATVAAAAATADATAAAAAAAGGKSGKIREVYRVKLPGNPVLGEGKPENQNHAIIFTRGRYLQAIDMNQDGYFEEALKMRNVLLEFKTPPLVAPVPSHHHGHDTSSYPTMEKVHQTAIVGFREHIFTGSVSSVANYMALQELSFVTLGQRVLNRPLKIRQHYGHPDFFDKFFVMTEGGMSKASKGINLSEDVFAGFNATIRGHMVDFVEYVQCGKGRDVGLQQTYNFEAKLSQGNAEQSISRDVSRIGNRLDFFRLLSFYYGGIGHYLSNTLVMVTLVVVIYTMLAFAIYGEEGVNGRPMHPEGVFQILLAGMGILQTLPLFVTLTVEKGFAKACVDIFWMIVSGGPLYFIFHIQTKCYYFSQTLLAGGAKYRPTGRGFVTRHSPFKENYRSFATSHIYVGFELVVALVLFAYFTSSKQYFALTWSLWLATISFILGPFWFNPASFDWPRIHEDYITWQHWLYGQGGTSEQSWEMWWKEETQFYKSLSTTWQVFLFVQKVMVWAVIANGLFGGFDHQWHEEQRLGYVLGLLTALLVGNTKRFDRWIRHWSYFVRRSVSLVWTTVFGVALIVALVEHPRHVLSLVALYYLGGAGVFLGLLLGYGESEWLMTGAFVHDWVVGHFLFALLAVFSMFRVHKLQTWLLYHNALSQKVEMNNILQRVRRSQEQRSSSSATATATAAGAAAAAGATAGAMLAPPPPNVWQDLETIRRQMQEHEQALRQLQQVAEAVGLRMAASSSSVETSAASSVEMSAVPSAPASAPAPAPTSTDSAALAPAPAMRSASASLVNLGDVPTTSVDSSELVFSQKRNVPRY